MLAHRPVLALARRRSSTAASRRRSIPCVAPSARWRECSAVWYSSGTRAPAARSSRRTGRAGGRATRRLTGSGPCAAPAERAADEGAQVRLAERALAGAHGHRGVALEELRRAIALFARPGRARRPRCPRRGRRSPPPRRAAARSSAACPNGARSRRRRRSSTPARPRRRRSPPPRRACSPEATTSPAPCTGSATA